MMHARGTIEWKTIVGDGSETIESGALSPVLQAATHEELAGIVDALDQGIDIFIKRNPIYLQNRHDLTKVAGLIATTLCQAGGHSLRNFFRSGQGPDYRIVLADVCDRFKVRCEEGMSTIDLEVALLQKVIARVLQTLPEDQRSDLLARLAGTAGRPVLLGDLLNTATPFSAIGIGLMPMLLEQLGLFGGRAALAGTLGVLAWPVAIVTAVAGLASNLAGPTYKATIPAVIRVAIIRQRLLWKSAV
jgi:uncharacterized protein YaaW (UPF0174 family)